MDAALLDTLTPHQDRLGARVAEALRAHDAPHYRATPQAELLQRCQRLVDAFLESVRRGGPEPFAGYVRGIAGERVEEGFALREVQQALSCLEEEVWPIVAESGGDTGTVVRRLAMVTGIVGRGKDELARAFLQQLERCGARVGQLQKRLDALFRGTEPPPQG